MYLLDTNACIRILKNSSESIVKRLRQIDCNKIKLCSVVKGELIYGAYHSEYIHKNLKLLKNFFTPFECLPYDDDCDEEYGKIRAELASKGLLIGPNDLMIAATAKANDLIIITHNVREFSRVNGLKIEDWEKEETD
ncbi:tRNA(fMet)-specific endonuclease VapC [Candidatus Magnetomoraceae bacterium gMMP-15]